MVAALNFGDGTLPSMNRSFACMDISLDIIIISVANVSNNPGVNLLVTEITITGLLVLKGSWGCKKWFLK